MATTTSLTTTYAGEHSGKWVAAALLSGDTIANGGLTVLPNVKYKTVINKLGTDGILKDASCDFTATSTVTITERTITPKELQVNLQLCRKDLHSSWQASEMGYSAFDVLPKSFADYLIAYAASKVAAAVEVSLWSGATGTSGQFNGFETLLAADASLPTANEVAGTTVTASNVITELGKLVDAIPAAVYGKDDLKIYASRNIVKAYIRALGGFGASGLGANGTNNAGTQWYNNGALSFDGIPIFMCSGMSNNVAIAAETSNLYFATGLMSDQNEVKVIDMADIDGSQNVRIVMRMTGAVNYANVEDITTYGITNSAN